MTNKALGWGKAIPIDFILWLEFEVWESQPSDDPEVDFFNMEIPLGDGSVYALNIWTFKTLQQMRFNPGQFGNAGLVGKYCTTPDLLVERMDRTLIEEIVSDLIETDSLNEEWLVDRSKNSGIGLVAYSCNAMSLPDDLR